MYFYHGIHFMIILIDLKNFLERFLHFLTLPHFIPKSINK